MKILLSLIILENKLSFLKALKIRVVWRVTRLQSKICKGLQDCLSGKVRLQDYLSEGRVTRVQKESKVQKSFREGKGSLLQSLSKAWTLEWKLGLKIWT